jgi:hypothetical protein
MAYPKVTLDLRSLWVRFAAFFCGRQKMKNPPELNTGGLLRYIAHYCNMAYAEREGFEPPVGSSPTTVFKTVAINRSAISPGAKI